MKSRKDCMMVFYSRIILFPFLLLISQTLLAQLPLLERKILLPEQEATVENVIKEISRQGGFTFSYTSNISIDRMIHLEARERTVKECLEELFNHEEVEFV